MASRVVALSFALLLIASSGGAAQSTLDPRFGIDEGLSHPTTMAEIGAGWDRVLVPWYRIQPRGPGDVAGDGPVTWLGTDDELAGLLKMAYLAAKQANPRAVVSFPATTTWVDVEHGRPLLYARVLDILARDPQAATHGFYHDAAAL